MEFVNGMSSQFNFQLLYLFVRPKYYQQKKNVAHVMFCEGSNVSVPSYVFIK